MCDDERPEGYREQDGCWNCDRSDTHSIDDHPYLCCREVYEKDESILCTYDAKVKPAGICPQHPSLREEKPVVVKLKRVEHPHFTQWHGKLHDGRWLYIDYRFGWLYVALSPTILHDLTRMAIIEHRIFEHTFDSVDRAHDSRLGDLAMQAIASRVLQFETEIE